MFITFELCSKFHSQQKLQINENQLTNLMLFMYYAKT